MLKLYYDSKLDVTIKKESQLLTRARAGKSNRGVNGKTAVGMKRLRMSLYQEVCESLMEIHLHNLEISRKRFELRPQITANYV